MGGAVREAALQRDDPETGSRMMRRSRRGEPRGVVRVKTAAVALVLVASVVGVASAQPPNSSEASGTVAAGPAAASRQSRGGVQPGKPAYLVESDHLSYLDEHQKSLRLLEGKLPLASGPRARAEIYWRLARDTFDLANAEQSVTGSGAKVLAGYEQSEKYADEAIALGPDIAHGYFWKAANVGKIAQIHNLLRAFLAAGTVRDLLVKAVRLDPADGQNWYVLAQLYSQIPGFPLSFGNTAYAVSLGRKGIDARKAQVADGTEPNVPEDFYIQLARELVRRNWSKSEREQRHRQEARDYHRNTGLIEKNFYYEGIVHIPAVSDRAEAISIDESVVARLDAVKRRTQTQDTDLHTAHSDLKVWTR